METVKAKFLNKYILTSITAFNDAIEQESVEGYEIGGELVNFKVLDFEIHYEYFLRELEGVILETSDIYIVHDYVDSCLNDIIRWRGFNSDQNKDIFAKGSDVSYLIKLKQNIEKYSNLIKEFSEIDSEGTPIGLIKFYNATINSTQLLNFGNKQDLEWTTAFENGDLSPDLDLRFDYKKMKAECDELKNTYEKILFINDRLNYLKQWQLQYDIEEELGYKFTPYFYPNFENLCQMELDRLEKKFELEKKMNIPTIKVIEPTLSEKEPANYPYIWNCDNNDLIELVTAMFMVKAIKRDDDKKITQTELTDFFEKLFNLEVKNDKETRAYISDPLTTRPLFLEKLKKGFIQYREAKTEKKPDIFKTRKTGY